MRCPCAGLLEKGLVCFTYMCYGAGVPLNKQTHTVWTGVMWNSDPVFETRRTSERRPEEWGGFGLRSIKLSGPKLGLKFQQKKVNR